MAVLLTPRHSPPRVLALSHQLGQPYVHMFTITGERIYSSVNYALAGEQVEAKLWFTFKKIIQQVEFSKWNHEGISYQTCRFLFSVLKALQFIAISDWPRNKAPRENMSCQIHPKMLKHVFHTAGCNIWSILSIKVHLILSLSWSLREKRKFWEFLP